MFTRRPARICQDPPFGRLEAQGRGAWHGSVPFPPVARDVDLAIVTGGPEPGELARAAFAELVHRYDALRPAIGDELFHLYIWRPRGEDLRD